MNLFDRMEQMSLLPREVAIFSLGQAGYCIKKSADKILCIDPYLSDSCERLFGFKRLIPSPIRAEELMPDVLICTHSHADHLDIDSLPTIARSGRTFFVGATDCKDGFAEAGIVEEKTRLLSPGESVSIEEFEITAVIADHGELAPEAIGVIINVDGVKIYNAGDTALLGDDFCKAMPDDIDIMIAPINGAYGNLNEVEACDFARCIGPKILMGSHYGMFAEHGGSPAKFLEEASSLSGIKAVALKAGEMMTYALSQGGGK